MRRHLARLLQRAAVFQVGRDARAAEGVVAYFGGDAGRLGAPAHHSPSIVSVEPLTIELRRPTTQAADTRANVNTITPIKARSRNPVTVSLSIERSSSPASSAVSTGVLPLPSFWRGAFTESAGLCSITPPAGIFGAAAKLSAVGDIADPFSRAVSRLLLTRSRHRAPRHFAMQHLL